MTRIGSISLVSCSLLAVFGSHLSSWSADAHDPIVGVWKVDSKYASHRDEIHVSAGGTSLHFTIDSEGTWIREGDRYRPTPGPDGAYAILREGRLEFHDDQGLISAYWPAVEASPDEFVLTPGQQFLSDHYDQLLGFKDDSEFHKVGFGRGGDYWRWQEAVEAHRDAPNFTVFERVAVADLWQIGLQYALHSGQDDEYTQYARKEIENLLKGED